MGKTTIRERAFPKIIEQYNIGGKTAAYDYLRSEYGIKHPYFAYSARTAHPFQRNGAPFRFKLSKAQQVD